MRHAKDAIIYMKRYTTVWVLQTVYLFLDIIGILEITIMYASMFLFVCVLAVLMFIYTATWLAHAFFLVFAHTSIVDHKRFQN